MSSVFGQYLRVTVFGQSHGEAIGAVADGLPAGMAIDMDALRTMMRRRAPGQSALTTARREKDEPEFLSGVLNGVTTGQPLALIIRNEDRPGNVADVSRILSEENINIATFNVNRNSRGGEAVMVIECDTPPDETLLRRIRALPGILRAVYVSQE